MIKFITTGDTLPLRSLILRNGLDPDLCHFEGDDEPSSFHLAYVKDDRVLCAATFHKQNRDGFSGTGFQLRGMATLTGYQGMGIGNQLLNFAIVYLKGRNVNYLWCNARKTAYHFYQGIGFEFISDEFDVKNIGLHRAMYLKIMS